ncbi:GNAT family N-acetyltransferase [Cytobacillus massiliigabonensis]|uniref:GNAT family N-acetyltransferase n=1 Tax=Cytobacillus massiliigabonensis TaxID=1871011 RepID=UPI000C851BA9|nr:GNAT family N-acetyltransferase [Cytobacillus massiliigabonensis]
MHISLGLKILDGTPNYFVIEDIGRVSSIRHFEKLLQEMMVYVRENGIQSVSIVLNEKESANIEYLDLLRTFDFWQQETQYFYKRDLSSFKHSGKGFIEIKSIEQTSADLFKEVWQETTIGMLNASSTLSVEKEFIGMKSELGHDYAKSCLIAFYGNSPIGITMPHIEPGTADEGRIFYFGLLPRYRRKGWGSILHKLSLYFLKNMGASYYIGATGHKNIPMQRIFQVNGCQMFEKKFTYRLKGHSN